MSTFAPADYAEAVLTHKPMRRTRMTPSLPPDGKTRSASGKPRKQASGLKRRPSPAIPYATNSLGARKKAKRKKLTDGQLKKRVWKEFSIFIRTRGADSEGMNNCLTCGVRKHWKELQAGHFVRGRLNANLFDARGCWPQCYSCNVGKQGNVIPYYKRMLERYGQMVIDDLVTQNNNTRKWQAGELQEMLERYKAINAANPLLKEQP